MSEGRTGAGAGPTIVLEVIEGPLKGLKYRYDKRDTALIGRGLECSPRLPDDYDHRTISRSHCIIDIDPPKARVRDFGSLNGTFVNGVKIGQRMERGADGSVSLTDFAERDLVDGDEIRLGATIFKIALETGADPTGSGIALSRDRPDDGGDMDELIESSFASVAARIDSDSEVALAADSGAGASDDEDSGGAIKVCDELTGSGGGKKSEDEVITSSPTPTIKGYRIVRELGRGGMGSVYLAESEKVGSLVALKTMLPDVADDEDARRMFLREVECAKMLTHPNIVQLLDSGYDDGLFYYTMEYCEGGGVNQLMEREGGRLKIPDAIDIAFQALDGLEYAHTAKVSVTLPDGSTRESIGLVHRDIKPSNIFITGDPPARRAKIADIGLGKAFDLAGLSGQTKTGSVIGTPFFIPRQQVINFKYAKVEVDVWSMAATLYNMLTGKLPRMFLKGKDPWQVVLQSPPVPIRERYAGIPDKLADVIDHALTDQPEIPVKSARELKELLQSAIE